MKLLSPRKFVTALSLLAALTCITVPSHAQGVLDKLKKAAEDASKKNPPAAKPPAQPAPAAQPKPATATPSNTPANTQQPAPTGGKAAATSTAAAQPDLVPSTAKVEPQLLVNGEAGMRYSISPHGVHLAAITSKGSRVVITEDATEGPRFDEIVSFQSPVGSAWVRFNDDGSHYTYVGRLGQEYVVMMDQKEIGRGPYGSDAIVTLGFTPGGKHVYYITKLNQNTRNHLHLVIDGKPGPESNDTISALFSPDGEHHAYLLSILPLSGSPSSPLVVDGKTMPYAGAPIAYTADSAHLFTQVQMAGGIGISVDGKEFMKAQNAHLYMAPAGNGFMAVVSQGTQTQPGGVQFLVIGNQKVPGSECLGAGGIVNVYYSADAKHWSAKCQATNTSYWIMTDGKKGLEYQTVGNVRFTSDGKPVYVATNNGKNYLVTGEDESSGYTSILQPIVRGEATPATIAGRQVGFIGVPPGTTDNYAVVVGTNKPLTRKAAAHLILSADGSRFAFTSPDGGANVDGVDDGSAVSDFYQMIDDHGRNPGPDHLLFSPDGKHIFHFGRPTINDPNGIVIDGKYFAVGRGASPTEPVFTPDSKHIFWLDHDEGSAISVYLDGKRAAQIEFSLPPLGGWYEMGTDGALSVITQEGTDLKRLRITPADDGGLDKLIAAARPLPKK